MAKHFLSSLEKSCLGSKWVCPPVFVDRSLLNRCPPIDFTPVGEACDFTKSEQLGWIRLVNVQLLSSDIQNPLLVQTTPNNPSTTCSSIFQTHIFSNENGIRKPNNYRPTCPNKNANIILRENTIQREPRTQVAYVQCLLLRNNRSWNLHFVSEQCIVNAAFAAPCSRRAMHATWLGIDGTFLDATSSGSSSSMW